MKQEDLIYGKNPIREALKAHRVLDLWMSENFKDAEIFNLIDKENIHINYVKNAFLDNLIPDVPNQGIIAKIRMYQYCDLKELIYDAAQAQKGEKKIILILDGINDPQNFGAILRSADVFGVIGVIISKHHQVPLNATVAKTSAGAINHVKVALVGNLNNAIKELKDNGFWVASTDGSGDTDYNTITYDFPIALVIGSEGYGVSSLVLRNSDYIIKIPMYGHVNSLNASVTAGILLSKCREKDYEQ